VGEAFNAHKSVFAPNSLYNGCYRWIQFCLNLQGEPALKIMGVLPVLQVSVSSSKTTVSEWLSDDPADLVISFSQAHGDVTLRYSFGGSARYGIDYITQPPLAQTGSLAVPAGSEPVTVRVIPLNDSVAEGRETIDFILHGTGDYDLGNPSHAELAILDDENRSPVVANLSVSAKEDTPKEIVLSASDPDGDTVSVVVVRPPLLGAISGLSGNRLMYAPSLNLNGNDRFSFIACDDKGACSEQAFVLVRISSANDYPIVKDKSVITGVNMNVTIPLTAFDVEGSSCSYFILGQPVQGTFMPGNNTTAVEPGTGKVLLNPLIYAPALGYVGADSFTFKASDGSVDSGTATVSISIIDTGGAPIAQDQSVALDEDSRTTVTVSGSDPEGSNLTYNVVSRPIKGSIIWYSDPTKITYTPNHDFWGTDSFTFKVNDGVNGSNDATVAITVKPVNDAPVLEPIGTKTANVGQMLQFSVAALDIDDDTLAFTALGLPQGAQFSPSTRVFSWQPEAGQAGAFKATFSVSDGMGGSDTETIEVRVSDSSVVFGDITGDEKVSAYDASLAGKVAVGKVQDIIAKKESPFPEAEIIRRADVSGTNGVSSYDASLIVQYAVGLITKFPVEN